MVVTIARPAAGGVFKVGSVVPCTLGHWSGDAVVEASALVDDGRTLLLTLNVSGLTFGGLRTGRTSG